MNEVNQISAPVIKALHDLEKYKSHLSDPCFVARCNSLIDYLITLQQQLASNPYMAVADCFMDFKKQAKIDAQLNGFKVVVSLKNRCERFSQPNHILYKTII